MLLGRMQTLTGNIGLAWRKKRIMNGFGSMKHLQSGKTGKVVSLRLWTILLIVLLFRILKASGELNHVLTN
jgi:hypothetical protein